MRPAGLCRPPPPPPGGLTWELAAADDCLEGLFHCRLASHIDELNSSEEVDSLSVLSLHVPEALDAFWPSSARLQVDA